MVDFPTPAVEGFNHLQPYMAYIRVYQLLLGEISAVLAFWNIPHTSPTRVRTFPNLVTFVATRTVDRLCLRPGTGRVLGRSWSWSCTDWKHMGTFGVVFWWTLWSVQKKLFPKIPPHLYNPLTSKKNRRSVIATKWKNTSPQKKWFSWNTWFIRSRFNLANLLGNGSHGVGIRLYFLLSHLNT